MNQLETERKSRFKKAVKSLGIDRQVIADDLGYKKRYLDQILSAEKEVSQMVIVKFTKRYKRYSEDWLLHGTGQMLNDDEPTVVAEPALEYRKGAPGEQLQRLLDGHDKRIADLETELRLLKDMEAEVHRLRGLVEGLVKGGEVKE